MKAFISLQEHKKAIPFSIKQMREPEILRFFGRKITQNLFQKVRNADIKAT